MMMIRVLFTCCSWHVIDIAKSLVCNPDGVAIEVYAANCNDIDLPGDKMFTKTFVLPKISEDSYVGMLLDICKDNKIDIIIPMATVELELMAKNKELFRNNGITVAVNDYDKIRIANDKRMFYDKFSRFMPEQVITNDADTIRRFIGFNVNVCCKLNGLCGGKGFAVVDNEKYTDPTLFHAYGFKHYISQEQLYEILKKNKGDVILQKYINGTDYSVSVLCDHGKVVYKVGYYGYALEFGAIMNGEIKNNCKALDMVDSIVRTLSLDGLASFDFMCKGEDVYLLECNPRVSASLAFVDASGCNMVYYECLRLLGKPIPNFSEMKIKYGLKMKKHFGSEYYI